MNYEFDKHYSYENLLKFAKGLLPTSVFLFPEDLLSEYVENLQMIYQGDISEDELRDILTYRIAQFRVKKEAIDKAFFRIHRSFEMGDYDYYDYYEKLNEYNMYQSGYYYIRYQMDSFMNLLLETGKLRVMYDKENS